MKREFKCSCPTCGQHIQGDSQWEGQELQCPACQETMVVPRSQPIPVVASSPTPCPPGDLRLPGELPGWARVVWLGVLGVLTPFIVGLATVLPVVLGTLGMIVGPVLGVCASAVITRHCLQSAPPRRFWVYHVSVVSVYGLSGLAVLLPGGSSHGVQEPSLGGSQAAASGGLVILLFLGSSIMWLLGFALGVLRGEKNDQEPNFP